MKIKLAENIKFYRNELGLTQRTLAEKVLVAQSRLSNYENGFGTPDVYTLCRLAEIFGITLDELVEWTGEGTDRSKLL